MTAVSCLGSSRSPRSRSGLGLRRGELLALRWVDVDLVDKVLTIAHTLHVQDVLGHSSPTVTKTIYVDATRKIQRDAIERLGFLFDA